MATAMLTWLIFACCVSVQDDDSEGDGEDDASEGDDDAEGDGDDASQGNEDDDGVRR
jgi:hypothetical protein